MRRLVLCTLAVLVTVTMLAPASAFAQAPAPKVTINGLIDMVSGMTWNMSRFDNNYQVRNDNEWYARTRLRPDIIGEIGTTKAVIGFEFDYGWGDIVAGPRRAGLVPAGQNTDFGLAVVGATGGVLEVKWGYLEFKTPGLPIESRMRLGAQPWTATYKNFLAHGDHAGVNWTGTLTPNVRLHLTYSQVTEAHTGAVNGFLSGDDYALVSSVEIIPFKGLDIRPLYAFFAAHGITGGAARQGRGGVPNAFPVGATPGFALGDVENRHTIGFDARWSTGPFYLDPTFVYQFGNRDVTGPNAVGVVASRRANIRAWFIDVRGGFRAGPLLLEAAGIWTSGNRARDNLQGGATVRHYQPISTDTGYYGGWANIYALGTDYYKILYGGVAGLNPGVAIGYDQYGLIRFGVRGTYAITPAFSVLAGVHPSWTSESVDTGRALVAPRGLTPPAPGAVVGPRRSYLGTEVNAGIQWRFAPGVVFDLTGAHLFAGDAIAHAASPNPRDASLIAGRVRFTF